MQYPPSNPGNQQGSLHMHCHAAPVNRQMRYEGPGQTKLSHVSWNKTVAPSSNNIQGIKATALAAYMVLRNALAGLRAFSARSCSEMLVYSNERNRAEFGNMMCSVCQHFIATYIHTY